MVNSCPPILSVPALFAVRVAVSRTVTDAIPFICSGPITVIQLELLLTNPSQFCPGLKFITNVPPVIGTVNAPPKEHTVWLCIALKIFSRPPVLTIPEKAGRRSTLFINDALSEATERSGLYADNNAAAPATCGVAIDVPLSVAVEVFDELYVLNIPDPGAARSTLTGPKFEKPDLVSDELDEATDRTLGDV